MENCAVDCFGDVSFDELGFRLVPSHQLSRTSQVIAVRAVFFELFLDPSEGISTLGISTFGRLILLFSSSE